MACRGGSVVAKERGLPVPVSTDPASESERRHGMTSTAAQGGTRAERARRRTTADARSSRMTGFWFVTAWS
jgi:hypothetical protein